MKKLSTILSLVLVSLLAFTLISCPGTVGTGGGINDNTSDDDYNFGGTKAPTINKNTAIAVFEDSWDLGSDGVIGYHFYFYSNGTFQWTVTSDEETTCEYRGTYTGDITAEPIAGNRINISATITGVVAEGYIYTEESTVWATLGALMSVVDEIYLENTDRGDGNKTYLVSDESYYNKIK